MPIAVQLKEVSLWEPQPGPQELLLHCPCEDIFFGGARGGGKTDGLLGDWLSHAEEYGQNARGVFFRRTYPELEEVERRASEIFPQVGAALNVQKRTWVWSNGATLRLRYLKRDSDADHYQGHSYTWIGVDELTQWSSLAPIDKLRATLRSAAGVPCLFRASGNPGGPGHNLVKARYIDPAPPYAPFYDKEAKTYRVFIPSKLEDNPALVKNDPNYWQRVEAAASGREDLIKAWRLGLWDIVAGGAIDDLWNPKVHIVAPFKIPHSWRIRRAFDWGSSHPFSVGWWAESDGTTAPNGKIYAPGTRFRIAEWYGWKEGKPNEGLKMLAVDVARGIWEREQAMGYKVNPGPADPSIYAAENGVCIADDMAKATIRNGEQTVKCGVVWQPADNAPGSRKTGLERMRKYLKASLQTPMEEPGLFIFNTCRQWIRTVPVIPRDTKKPDDVETTSEDHLYDETRYELMDVRKEAKIGKLIMG